MAKDDKDCPHITDCPMFTLFRVSGTEEIWKVRYCLDEYEKCARHELNQQGQIVPIDLLPNGRLLRKGRR